MRHGAAALAVAARANAGTIASSNGSATAVPRPFSNIRRSIDLPGSNVPSNFFSHLERSTIHDLRYKRGKSIAARIQPLSYLVHCRAVIALDTPTKSIRQHSLREVA